MRPASIGLLLAIAISLIGCTGVFLEVGAGKDHHIDEGRNPQSLMRVRAEREPCSGMFPRVVCFAEFNHHSSIRDGWPFNRNPEDLTNQWSGAVRIPLWKAKR